MTCYFPEGEDLTGAATALLRLQDTYDLPTSKIARGDIAGVEEAQSKTLSGMYLLLLTWKTIFQQQTYSGNI